jgi:hypothetical protein
MRYKEKGDVHLDFHGALNTTIDYIVKNYGLEVLHQIFFNVGTTVYKDIREHLERGDSTELVNFWKYFFDREKAKYHVEIGKNFVKLTVDDCPAVRQVIKLGLPLSKHFCDQTIYMNEGLCHGTCFKTKTTITGQGSCVQLFEKGNE